MRGYLWVYAGCREQVGSTPVVSVFRRVRAPQVIRQLEKLRKREPRKVFAYVDSEIEPCEGPQTARPWLWPVRLAPNRGVEGGNGTHRPRVNGRQTVVQRRGLSGSMSRRRLKRRIAAVVDPIAARPPGGVKLAGEHGMAQPSCESQIAEKCGLAFGYFLLRIGCRH